MPVSMQAMMLGVACIRGCRAFSTNGVVGHTGRPGSSSSSPPSTSSASAPSLTSKVGFSFTPGGLLFPYHLGVAKCLENEGFLAVDTPLAGASAGAIAAAVIGCGMDIETASFLSGRVFQDCREGGVVFRLKEIVQEALQKALPPNAHDIINNRKGPVTIGITQLFPKPKGVFQPFMNVRGKATVDGFFAVPRMYFGSPEIPSADQVVRVTVFPTSMVEMHSDQPGDVISPDLLDRYESGRFLELVNYAVNPASEDVMEELFQAGSESGSIWCSRYGDDYRRRHEENYAGTSASPSSVE